MTLVLIIVAMDATFACLNGESKALKSGLPIYEDQEGLVPYGHDFFNNQTELNAELKKLDSLYHATNDLDYLSDKGIVLILLGQYERAIELYLEIEKVEPNRYSTASNIGTAYELIGQNENALKWIIKSIEIDSSSHYNSEWIHARILEAKIKGEQFQTTEFLLKTSFGSGDAPDSEMSKDELKRLHLALYFQLNERMSFVKPNDKIVAQLLFDLGNIAFLRGYYAVALEDYRLAKKYGMGGELIEMRIDRATKHDSYFVEILIATISVVILGLIIYKRRTQMKK